MKMVFRILFFYWMVLLVNDSYAQLEVAFKTTNAWYGSTTEGICLFDDGQYLLYGYATLVGGQYYWKDNNIVFHPFDADKNFEVYGSHNKRLSKGARYLFVNFEERETFFHLHADTMFSVMNPTFNCSSGPYVWKSEEEMNKLFLGEKVNDLRHFQVENKDGYNDFILIYFPQTRYNQPFSGALSKKDNLLKFQLNNGSNFEFEKHKIEEADENWQFMLSVHDRLKHQNEDVLYANEDYNIMSSSEVVGYQYVVDVDLYINKEMFDGAQNWKDFYPEDYSDVRVLREYKKIKKVLAIDFAKEPSLSEKSLFFADCENSELSYQYGVTYRNEYDTFKKAEEIMMEDDGFGSFKPYKIDRKEDGIYEVSRAEGNVIIADTPVMSGSYFQKAILDISQDGNVSILLQLIEEGKEVFAFITENNINKQLAIIINGEVITMATVVDRINTTEIAISGDFTVESANKIINSINNK